MITLTYIDVKELTVSVPYRGATFLNDTPENEHDCKLRFRPLSGSYISQLIDRFLLLRRRLKKVSVPYRGATFLNSTIINKSTTC